MPIEGMVENIIRYIGSFQPQDKQAAFFAAAKAEINYDEIKKLAVARGAEIFTARDLDTLKRLYGSQEGRAIAEKFAVYLAAVVPMVQAQLYRASQEALEKAR